MARWLAVALPVLALLIGGIALIIFERFNKVAETDVDFAEITNQRACFAPMSWSTSSRIDSAPSFAIASRGSTPLGQRSLQK